MRTEIQNMSSPSVKSAIPARMLALTGRLRSRAPHRAGTVTVEFAVCAVVFFSIVFTILEFSRYVFVRHSVQMVAYEAARSGIVPGATAEHVSQRAANLLSASGIMVADVSITPSVIDNATEQVIVTISCAFSENSWLPPTFLTDRVITTSVTLEHENKAYLNQQGVDITEVIGDNEGEPVDT